MQKRRTYPQKNHIIILEIPSNTEFADVVTNDGFLKGNTLNFAHVILPERFTTFVDPAISIAEFDAKLGSMVYIAYGENGAQKGFGTLGRIVTIPLQTLFEIAVSGRDLWPEQNSNPNGEPGIRWHMEGVGTDQRRVYDLLDWYWGYFDYQNFNDVRSLNMKSNGIAVCKDSIQRRATIIYLIAVEKSILVMKGALDC